MPIEIEKRGLLTQEAYDRLLKLAQQDFQPTKTKRLRVIYYLFNQAAPAEIKEASLKIAFDLDRQTARLVGKFPTGAAHAAKELEKETDFETAEYFDRLIWNLQIGQRYQNEQQRADFAVDGFKIPLGLSLKFSTDWQYHLEIDTLLETEKEAAQAEIEIDALASRLGVNLMSTSEERAFQENILKNRRPDPLV